MRATTTLILTVPLLFAAMGTAFAHAHLRSAVPSVESIVIVPPREVTIAFTEGVEPRYSTIVVTNAHAQRVDDAKPHLAEGDAKRLSVGLQDLTPGTYTVAWQATSVDTHKTDGTYRFTIAATDASGIGLEHVWARPTAGATTTGAAYFTITDSGKPDRLVGVSSPAAATAELHETINDNGVMKMRPVQSIALAPGKPVTFKPGGYHVMLMGLKQPLNVGDSFPLTLTFEHAQPIRVSTRVEAGGGPAMDHGAMPGMDHGNMPRMKGH